MFQKAARRALAYAWNLPQLGRTVAYLPALAVEGYRKRMRFVADQLDQMQHRRVMIKDYLFILWPENVNNFFTLGNRRQRLIDDLQSRQSFSSGMKLSQSAVDQDQAGHLFLFFLNAFVAARHHFSHR